MSKDVIFIQPHCGKYDIFILDMPLGLLYTARLLVAAGYNVHVIDQRVEKENAKPLLEKLLKNDPVYVGITAMTGEPVKHGLELSKFVKSISDRPVVWGGIHPTILPDQTLQNPNVDFIIKGKGEVAALRLAEALEGKIEFKDVPGLSYKNADGALFHNPEDNEESWDEMPMVSYDLVDFKKYYRVGFEDKVFSIMTSRNCPHKCSFCYNSSIKGKKRWSPDGMDYTKKHIDYILEKYQPNYLSFIDDDFFVDRKRAREILEYVKAKNLNIKIGFRGARVSDLIKLDDEFFDLLESVSARHINIGVESGSPRILKIIKKGITVEQVVELNKRFAKRPSLTPLYNFFSGIPQETEEDVKMSTDLILKLVKENPYCQISGYHQYTPYPGNELFTEAVAGGFPEPRSLEDWGEMHFEDNARNCPWIDAKRRKLLDMVYSMIYFVDGKYDMYFAKNNFILKALFPFVKLYKPIARFRLRRHFTAFPVEVTFKNWFYKIYYSAG